MPWVYSDVLLETLDTLDDKLWCRCCKFGWMYVPCILEKYGCGGQKCCVAVGVAGDSSSESERPSLTSAPFAWWVLRACLTMVVLRQKVFMQLWCEQVYGRFPVWIRRWRAKLEDCISWSAQTSDFVLRLHRHLTYV